MLNKPYTIKDLERITGIRAHTIRIWESRYAILKPDRTGTNIRRYTHEELKTMLNIACLQNYGWKISKLALMSREELMSAYYSISENGQQPNEHDPLLMSVFELDENIFQHRFAELVKHSGITSTIENFVFPVLIKIGNLWQSGVLTAAHEHFFSQLIRQKLYSAIDTIKQENYLPWKKIILFTPPGELHEMGLLYAQYLFKSNGFNTMNLGVAVPFPTLKPLMHLFCPDYLYIHHTLKQEREFNSQLSEMLIEYKNIKVILGGNISNSDLTDSHNQVLRISSADDLRLFLSNPAD